jgi:acetyltransferase
MPFVALDEGTGRMLGLVRLKDGLDEKTPEFAILVRSHLKGHGLGWLLTRRVIDYAKEKHLRRVYGDVSAENARMLQMCAELGFRTLDMGPEITRVVLDLENTPGLLTSQIPVTKRASLCQDSHQTTRRRNGASGIARLRMRCRAS